MKKLILPLLALLVISCNDGAPSETSSEPKVLTSRNLLDSATTLANSSDMANQQAAIELMDQAIAKDPDMKAAYVAKVSLYAKMKNEEAFLTSLETAESKFPNDAYLNMHLGMEYDLKMDTAKAFPLYKKSLENFVLTLDTMQSSELKRNSLLLNMAMANTLASEKLSETQISGVLTESEIVNFNTSEQTFAAMDRTELLSLRKK